MNKIKWFLIFIKINPKGVLYVESVIVHLGGKQRKLRYDFNAMSDFEQVTGQSLFNAMQNMGIGTIRALYWAGLKHQDKGLTLDRTGKMISKAMTEDGLGLEDLMNPAVEALVQSGILPKEALDGINEADDNYEEDEEDEGKNA